MFRHYTIVQSDLILMNVHMLLPSVGLKHVSDDQKTHKNPNLRSQGTPTKTKAPGAVDSPRATVQKRPPLLELEGKKWRVVRQCFMYTK